jgi:hypothetical protein
MASQISGYQGQRLHHQPGSKLEPPQSRYTSVMKLPTMSEILETKATYQTSRYPKNAEACTSSIFFIHDLF